MVRFLRSFRMHWYRSHGPIFPFKENPKSCSGTLTMASRVSGHENAIKVPRKLAIFLLITKTNTKHVKDAWKLKYDFGFFKNKPISDFTILDGFDQSKGLDRLKRYQGMCWTPQNRLKTAGNRIALCLFATVFFELGIGFLSQIFYPNSCGMSCVYIVEGFEVNLRKNQSIINANHIWFCTKSNFQILHLILILYFIFEFNLYLN